MLKRTLVARAAVVALASSALVVFAQSSIPFHKPTGFGVVMPEPPKPPVTPESRARAAALIAGATATIDAFKGPPEQLHAPSEPMRKAMKDLNTALDLDPDNPRLYIEFARIAITRTGLLPSAIQAADRALAKAIEVDPNSGDAYLLLAYVFAQTGRLQDAESALAKAGSMPHTTQWMEATTAQVRTQQQFVAEAEAQEQQEAKAARDALAKRVADSNGNRKVAAQRLADEAAKLLDEAGSTTRDIMGPALEKLNQAMALDPKVPRAHVEMARFAMRSGGLGQHALQSAERSLRTAIEIDPQFGDTYVLLGYVLTHADRLPEAEAAFATARKTPHTSQWLDANIAELREKQGRDDEAIEIFRGVAKKVTDPGVRGHALDWLAFNLQMHGNLDEADAAHQQLIALRPQSAFAKGNYGSFLRVRKLDLDRAEKYIRQALAIHDYPEARRSLAMTLYVRWSELWAKDSNSKRGAELFAEAQRLHPDMRELAYEVFEYPRVHPIIDAMVAKGVKVDSNPINPSGTTPMEIAATKGSMEMVRKLLEVGANPNTQGYNGHTGLMAAAGRGDHAMVQLLLGEGADPSLITADGRDAEAYALKYGHHPVANMLASAKRTYVRKPGALTRAIPFRVGVAYRVKKDWALDQSSTDSRFKSGETLVFDHATEFGDPDRARFAFMDNQEHYRYFAPTKDMVATWAEHFEEVGPAPKGRR